MKPTFIPTYVVIGFIITGFIVTAFKTAPEQAIRSPRENYLQYCAGCHGEQHERFAARAWVYGNSLKEVTATLKHGRPAIGMPEFAKAMNDTEIRELAEYTIREVAQVPKIIPSEFNVNEKVQSLDLTFKLEEVASGMNIPWGMGFLPDGSMLVTEKTGKLFHIKNGKQSEITGVPKTVVRGQGGLMEVLVHPEFKKNKLIYLSFADGDTPDKINTTIIRAVLKNGKLSRIQKIFHANPDTNSGSHFGCRMFFDKDGYLFFSIGERGRKENAQDLTNHCGKIHRIYEDGRIPADNPFVNTAGAMPTIWSYGHRNPQGLYYEKATNTIWENEHGPKGGDELNIVRKGLNYGWPVISFGINYDGTVFTNDTARVGMEQPFHYWTPSIGPSSLTMVTSDKYPAWKGDFMSGSLSFEYLERTLIKNNRVVGRERLMPKIGRIRNVVQGPDGYLYIAVEKIGKVFKIVPVQ
jgi:glucose/arabinose dehydrogenase